MTDEEERSQLRAFILKHLDSLRKNLDREGVLIVESTRVSEEARKKGFTKTVFRGNLLPSTANFVIALLDLVRELREENDRLKSDLADAGQEADYWAEMAQLDE